MGAKKKNNNKKKQKQPQKAQEVTQIEKSGTAPEIVPHAEPETTPALMAESSAPQLEVNVLEEINWKEIEEDSLKAKFSLQDPPPTEFRELSHTIEESDPDEQGAEVVHELVVSPQPIPEVPESFPTAQNASSVTPPIDDAHLEDPITGGDFFDQLGTTETETNTAVSKDSGSKHAELIDVLAPSPKVQVESAIKNLTKEAVIETPAQPKQAHEEETIASIHELKASKAIYDTLTPREEQNYPENEVGCPVVTSIDEQAKESADEQREGPAEKKFTKGASDKISEVMHGPETVPSEVAAPVEPKEFPKAGQDADSESDFFAQIDQEHVKKESSPSPSPQSQDQEADFFDKVGEEDQPELTAKEDTAAQAPEAVVEDSFFDKIGESKSTDNDFFVNISSPVKESEVVAQSADTPEPQELKPATNTLNLNFDDDDDFLESDEEPVPAFAAPPAPASLAFLEADDDLLSEEEEEQASAEAASAVPAKGRTVRPTQSLNFDTAKRGFDLPTELLSKTKVPARRAPEVILPPSQKTQAVPRPSVQHHSSASAPPAPMPPPKTPVNPYAALPKQSPKQPVVSKPTVPNVPEHILPTPHVANVAGSAGFVSNPYAAVTQQQPPRASPYIPAPTVPQAAQPSPYAPAPAQTPAQVSTNGPPTFAPPPLGGPKTAAPPKKSTSKYQRSADKDPYGFPELKKATTALRSRQGGNRAQVHNATQPSPNVTDFNVSYQQQMAQDPPVASPPGAGVQNAHPVSGATIPSGPNAFTAPYQQPNQAGGAPLNTQLAFQTGAARAGDSRVPQKEPELVNRQPMASSADALPMAPPKVSPYAPSQPASGRTTPLKPPSVLRSPRKTSLQSTPSESPYTDLHLSRPPSELGQYAPAPEVPQNHVPLHPAHISKSSVTIPTPVVHNASAGSALDDRLRRQIPVFSWGKESVVSAVPPEISYGQTMGTNISITSTKTLQLISETAAKYPGPLSNSKGAIKNKKKDLEKWTAEMASQADEHPLLWQLMAILVKELPQEEETKEIQQLLDPNVAAEAKGTQLKSAAALFEAGKKISGHSRQGSTQIQSIFDQIQLGTRDAALQTAIENREWAHALILAFSEGEDAWDSVVKEFVRIELRSQSTSSSQQLAFAYRVFAGSGASAVDELRPLRSSSSNDAAPSLEANLANWKTYAAIIMANRSKNDTQALFRLGELLVDHGQVEAGHFCFILSGIVTFGTDSMPALGVASASGHNLSSMLLSEVYEYVLLTRKTISLPLAQLVVYKAGIGGMLADCGYVSEGSKLSEAALVLARALRTPEILHVCERINQRCAADAGSGWISRKLSRPRLDKMFGTSFNKFVSGEDTIEEEQPQQQQQQQLHRPASAGPYGQNRSGYTPGPGMPSVNESRSSTPGAYDHYRVASPQFSGPSPAAFGMHSDFAPQGQYGMPQQYQASPSMQTYGHPGQSSAPGTPSPYIPSQPQTPRYAHQTQEYGQQFSQAQPQAYVPQPPQGYAQQNSYAPGEATSAPYAPQNAYAPPHQSASQINQYAPPVGPEPPVVNETAQDEPKVEAKKKADKKKDAKKEDKGDKKGWFGGWFGKNDEKDGKAIKAKLDSGSTFYFDEKLGKWVNKNGPPPEETERTAPPPMKKKSTAAPATSSTAPPMDAALAAPGTQTTASMGGFPPQSAPSSGPGVPTPSTSTPGASSGPPGAPATAPLPRAKARGSIDALLDGPPTTGTRKKRNARNRYVDVTQQ